MLKDHIQVDSDYFLHHANDGGKDAATSNHPKWPKKVLCAVYSHDGSEQRNRVQGIIETWGWRCDGFFVPSTKTVDDPKSDGFGSMIDLPHEGPESYKNMWQKTRSIWGYIYDNYLNDFDFFYLAGDDTHLIVENLRSFLQKWELEHSSTGDDKGQQKRSKKPLYLGASARAGYFKFALGGGGYVVNREALRIFVEEEALETCKRSRAMSAEDRLMGRCLKHTKTGILLTGAIDEENRQLFFHGTPQFHATYGGEGSGRQQYRQLVHGRTLNILEKFMTTGIRNMAKNLGST